VETSGIFFFVCVCVFAFPYTNLSESPEQYIQNVMLNIVTEIEETVSVLKKDILNLPKKILEQHDLVGQNLAVDMQQ